ncbi:MAG: hypothetical protein JXA25_06810 [Anaerolineales bacterium]|nr:hypothetical protein [Anaerolineales bacterium]
MLEIIAETVADAVAAQAGGATQLDLKSDLTEGGLSPTAGMLAAVRKRVTIDIVVMIRPHVRGTVYSPDDVEVMCHDIRTARDLGADGFLTGANTLDRKLDLKAIESFRQAAGDLPLHFHMFWMETGNQEKTLQQLIDLGAASVRTTGGLSMASKAPDGLEGIRKQRELAAGRIDLFLAGGVNAGNIARLVAETGVIHAHAGTGVRVPETSTGEVAAEKVRVLRLALDQAVAKIAG